MSMTDQYYSRLLAFARQNKSIKFIKNLENDTVEAVMNDGSTQQFPWEDVFMCNEPLNEQAKTLETLRHLLQK